MFMLILDTANAACHGTGFVFVVVVVVVVVGQSVAREVRL